jgi:hypothetical protein
LPDFSMRLHAMGTGLVVLCSLALGLSVLWSADALGLEELTHVQVSREELLEAMLQHSDYDPTATTNAPRFQAEVLLELVRRARERAADGLPLYLPYEDWFQAFLEATDCTVVSAPQYALLARRHGQDIAIDYRPERVIRRVVRGARPQVAANVKVWWGAREDGLSRYSYADTLSSPHLQVTNHRVITYRLLGIGGVVVYDDVTGVTGRPTSGILGMLFRLIGEGRVVQARMAISDDGVQVSRAVATRGFLGRTTTVTVFPDGRAENDVPAERPDLQALENQLREPLKIDYVPFSMAE